MTDTLPPQGASSPATILEHQRTITRAQFAAILQLALSTFDKKLAAREFPAPTRLNRLLRWDSTEIKRWLEAGCPDQATWNRIRAK